ncbi:hypothetical protein MY3296_005982 [Beauveria thailandica]
MLWIAKHLDAEQVPVESGDTAREPVLWTKWEQEQKWETEHLGRDSDSTLRKSHNLLI